MVSPEQVDPVTVAYLQAHDQRDRFNTIVSTIDVVAHHEEVSLRGAPPDAEELHEIMELPVHVTNDCHGAAHRLHIALVAQDFLRLFAEPLDVGLGEVLA